MSSEAPVSSNYLECIANDSTPDKSEGEKRDFHTSGLCGSWAMLGACENGHKFAKALDCGREWCSVCRESSHKRRMARWFFKAQKINEMSMLSLDFSYGQGLRTKKELNQIGRVVREVLCSLGFDRGLRRWHWFGEGRPWFGSEINLFHPHLHILLESCFLDPGALDLVKEQIREALGIYDLVIHYQYTAEVRRIVFWLKYVTRPTFKKRDWDRDMAEELHNFRNSVSWGRWDDKDKWELPGEERIYNYIGKIERGFCPCCGAKIHWTKAIKIEGLDELDYQQIWVGVWLERPPPRKVLDFKLLKIIGR